MSLSKVDLILHPVRLRILQALRGEELTTQEITNRLGDVPQSSIYRHLKLLLAGGLVAIAAARLVNGIQEKTYHLAQPPFLSPDDVADISPEQHGQYFATYVLSLLQGFQHYLAQKKASGVPLDLLADRVGYSDAAFYASTEEIDLLGRAINEALIPLLQNSPGPGRHKHKIAIITHPTES